MRTTFAFLSTFMTIVVLFSLPGCDDSGVDPTGSDQPQNNGAIDVELVGTWDLYAGIIPIQTRYLEVTESSITVSGQSLCVDAGVECRASAGQIFTVQTVAGGVTQKNYRYDYTVSSNGDTVYLRDDYTAQATAPQRDEQLVKMLVKSES